LETLPLKDQEEICRSTLCKLAFWLLQSSHYFPSSVSHKTQLPSLAPFLTTPALLSLAPSLTSRTSPRASFTNSRRTQRANLSALRFSRVNTASVSQLRDSERAKPKEWFCV